MEPLSPTENAYVEFAGSLDYLDKKLRAFQILQTETDIIPNLPFATLYHAISEFHSELGTEYGEIIHVLAKEKLHQQMQEQKDTTTFLQRFERKKTLDKLACNLYYPNPEKINFDNSPEDQQYIDIGKEIDTKNIPSAVELFKKNPHVLDIFTIKDIHAFCDALSQSKRPKSAEMMYRYAQGKLNELLVLGTDVSDMIRISCNYDKRLTPHEYLHQFISEREKRRDIQHRKI